MGSGWSSGSSWARSARGWCLVLCALVLCATWSRAADSESADGSRIETPSPSTPTGLPVSLPQHVQTLTDLVQAIETFVTSYESSATKPGEALRQYAKLKEQVIWWRQHSERLQANTKQAEEALTRSEALLASVSQKLDASTGYLEAERTESLRIITAREREARTWRTVGILALIAAALGWFVAAVT